MNFPNEKKTLHCSVFSLENKLVRLAWNVVYLLFFRFSPVSMFSWRRMLLIWFGAKIHSSARIYPSAKIWIPSNLSMGKDSTIGPAVNVYNQGRISLDERVIVSQYSHICASTHDYNDPLHPLILAPITIANDVWVCADAFVGPGSHLSEGSVIGARAVISKKTEPWSIYAGNPAKKIKDRRNFL
ncbi:hypothetical protein [Parathalassolituus penaei]|uniref:Colanic acid biosynthesis acetyltransferase n=1 Tax=Parathalassolituus penaei TaxID=2997323 RepID=A0A9X3EGU4_9GAMM|nr:hypothetical protein [Parathalassolituus penaei]MCY0966945.1 hypothetical protein [Parathalassolituus penaei]